MDYADLARWLYRGNRPNAIARVLNRGSAALHSLGIAPDYLVTLQVAGRTSGRTISFPLVMTKYAGERYLVSMLGEHAEWVRNVRAANGKVRIRHGRTEDVSLVETPVVDRAPIIKLYLARAPGARPHIAVDKDAPLQSFADAASTIPVFRVLRDTASG